MTAPLRLAFPDSYRVGWRAWGASRRGRLFTRPWQCEITHGDGCDCSAERAFTRLAAERRMMRAHNRRAAAGRCANRELRLYPPLGPGLGRGATDCEGRP